MKGWCLNLPSPWVEGENTLECYLRPLSSSGFVSQKRDATICTIPWHIESRKYLGAWYDASLQPLHPSSFKSGDLTFFSLSPMYIDSSSGPFTLRKWTLHSVATALASRVFPVPGGPNKRTPLRTFWPLKRSPWDKGKVMQLMISSFASWSPPTSAHCTFEAKVTATLDPPCKRFTACSMTCDTSEEAGNSKDADGCDMRTSVQTERRSVYDNPAVSLAITIPNDGSSVEPWPLGTAGALRVVPINLAIAKWRCASVGRGTSISRRKACRRGPPRSSKSSQDPATRISTRADLTFCKALVKASTTRRCCSNVAAGEVEGPALAKAWRRRKHKTQGEIFTASWQSSCTRAWKEMERHGSYLSHTHTFLKMGQEE